MKASKNLTRRRSTITNVSPEGVTLSGFKKPKTIPFGEFFDTYSVEGVPITHVTHAPAAVTALAKQDASTRLAKHFRFSPTKEPVQLSSVGFSEAQIEQLERAGFAEDGSMDVREFQRWSKARGGLLTPETEYRPRQFAGLREVTEAKPTYKPAGAVPETERVVSKTEKAAEAVRTAMRRAKARAEAIAEEEEQKEEAKQGSSGEDADRETGGGSQAPADGATPVRQDARSTGGAGSETVGGDCRGTQRHRQAGKGEAGAAVRSGADHDAAGDRTRADG